MRSAGARKAKAPVLPDEDEDEDEEDDEVERLRSEVKYLKEEIRDMEKTGKRAKTIFKTAPSSVDEETYKLLHPFLTRVTDSWPPYHHSEFVEGKEVFEMAGAYALEHVRKGIEFFSAADQGENQDKYHMLKLLEAVGGMSLPDSDSGDVKINLGPTEYVSQEKMAELSSDEDVKLASERKGEVMKTWRMDIGCSIINKAMKKIMEGMMKESPVGDWPSDWKWILRLAIECKEGKIVTRDFYQAVMYVVTYAVDRFRNQFPIDPVYAQVWTPDKLRMGLVDIVGFVRIRNRKLDVKSLGEYEKGLGERIARRGAKEDVARHYTRQALQEAFQRAQKKLLITHGYHYVDGWYPVGNVYMSSEELDFPRLTDGQQAMEHPHTKRFFQLLVRILLGNKMLHRTDQHLISVLEERSRKRKGSSDSQSNPKRMAFLKRAFQAENDGWLAN